MEETSALLASLVQTRSVQRALAPIAAQSGPKKTPEKLFETWAPQADTSVVNESCLDDPVIEDSSQASSSAASEQEPENLYIPHGQDSDNEIEESVETREVPQLHQIRSVPQSAFSTAVVCSTDTIVPKKKRTTAVACGQGGAASATTSCAKPAQKEKRTTAVACGQGGAASATASCAKPEQKEKRTTTLKCGQPKAVSAKSSTSKPAQKETGSTTVMVEAEFHAEHDQSATEPPHKTSEVQPTHVPHDEARVIVEPNFEIEFDTDDPFAVVRRPQRNVKSRYHTNKALRVTPVKAQPPSASDDSDFVADSWVNYGGARPKESAVQQKQTKKSCLKCPKDYKPTTSTSKSNYTFKKK